MKTINLVELPDKRKEKIVGLADSFFKKIGAVILALVCTGVAIHAFPYAKIYAYRFFYGVTTAIDGLSTNLLLLVIIIILGVIADRIKRA